MNYPLARLATIFTVLFATLARGGTLFVDLNSPNPTPPYSDWSTAATNIQDAIDASTDGDHIWVTNGVYSAGGRVMAGNLTNRVALNKAVTLQSVNGPMVTTIQGAGAVNGNAAVRCAWLTNDAALVGFTLTRGATRTSGDRASLESGGGVWCASSNAMVNGCIIVSNTALMLGGGAYQGSLNACFVKSNTTFSPAGGAIYSANLNNCTVVSNAVEGITLCNSTNCIVYYNSVFGNDNYGGGVLSYCCTTPLPGGQGNFTNAPQLFADSIHLSSTSPCIGAGSGPAMGQDIFGNTWANPPSVGCAEVSALPLVATPRVQLTSDPAGFTIGGAAFTGSGTFSFNWLKDGTPLQDDGHFSSTTTPNLVATGVTFADAGNYQLVVSNASGVATSAVAQVVIHCVNSAGANPTPPYTGWTTAATNIQDAIAVAAAQEIVLVTNGIYASGGKTMDNLITNRVSIDKAILVQSVNGPDTTIIQGAWDPVSTNGPGAVRCVWMTNNSILGGFTVRGGATLAATASPNQSMRGGGVWGSSLTNAVVNCVLTNNYASYIGGGAYSATLNSCTISGNHAVGSGTAGAGVANAGSGGGAANCNLRSCVLDSNFAVQSNGGGAQNCNATNCAFINNRAPLFGSGIYQGTLENCTLVNNTSGGYGGYGGAAVSATLVNCIVYGNFNIGPGSTNYTSCTFSYCDADPLPSGLGNIDVDPQLLPDNVHLSPNSLCIGAGTTNGLLKADIDGQEWNTPPSIGCDEWQREPVIALQPIFQAGVPTRHALSFEAIAAGQPPFNYFWAKNGILLQDGSHYANSTGTNLIVNDFGPDDAGSYQFIAMNAFGAVTSLVAQVVIHAVDAASANPQAPYSTWQNAAATIQDAIDNSTDGDIVLVTNGVYSSGGKVMVGDLTNRIALNKALTVFSVNGYANTVVEGRWDSVSTNGPGAIRCAWIGDGAVLNGFTLRNGATRGGSLITSDLQYGGGAWLSTSGLISNCVLTNNQSRYAGGGTAFGTVNNCFLTYNTSQYGGGAFSSLLNNCTIWENHTSSSIGGGGVCSCNSYNSIIANNYYSLFGNPDYQLANYPSTYVFSSIDTFTNCCVSPLPSRGSNNIAVSPLFLADNFHLAPASPCRGAGNPLYPTGYDIDGESFANPPSIGCDEFVETNMTGPLSVSFQDPITEVVANHRIGFLSTIEGRLSRLEWSFGEGPAMTNLNYLGSHTYTNVGTYTVTLTVYNVDHPEGVSSSVMVTVDPFLSPSLTSLNIVSNSCQFSFFAQAYILYTIQYTTNLSSPVTWQSMAQPVDIFTNGTVTITDPIGTNGMRFYRVKGQ